MGEKIYIYVGCAEGRYEAEIKDEKGNAIKVMKDYANIYVVYPVSDYRSDDYQAVGFKAEKMKCLSPDVWKDLTPGEKCKLYFDEKKTVLLATSVGEIIDLS